jgi:hypothetical protein
MWVGGGTGGGRGGDVGGTWGGRGGDVGGTGGDVGGTGDYKSGSVEAESQYVCRCFSITSGHALDIPTLRARGWYVVHVQARVGTNP